MTKDNLSSSDLKDRTVYVSVVNVADLPEAVAREISQGRVYSVSYTHLTLPTTIEV